MIAWLLLGAAWAGEAPEPAPDAEPAEDLDPRPSVKRRKRIHYPDLMYQLNTELLVCEVFVEVDADGRAAGIDTSACWPRELGAHAAANVSEWRWRPARVDGEAVPSRWSIKINYRVDDRPTMAAEDLAALIAAHQTIPDAGPSCDLRLTVHHDGNISGFGSDNPDRCLVIPAGGLDRVRLQTAWSAPLSCTARFSSVQGRASALQLEGCPPGVTALLRDAVSRWTWTAFTEIPVPYTAVITFAP